MAARRSSLGKNSKFSSALRKGGGAAKFKTDTDTSAEDFAAEVRLDDEQTVYYDKIIELLLAAGYFRARISGINSFDKVVGGMTWCITGSNVDVDVDLLFQENSTIGQRIALTEKIVAALPQMKCPIALEPHQIQGLDCKSIFPVIQWLVKKVLETRAEMGDYIRAFSVSQFSKEGRLLVADVEFRERQPDACQCVTDVNETYKPRRRFRQPDSERRKRAEPLGAEKEEERVQATLLEYGHRYRLSRQGEDEGGAGAGAGQDGSGMGAKQAEKAAEKRRKEEEEARAAEEAQIAALMGSMAVMGDKVDSAAGVGSFLDVDDIGKMASAHADKMAALEAAQGQQGGAGGLAAHRRQVAALEKQIAMAERQLTELGGVHSAASGEWATLHAELDQILKHHARIDDESAKLDALETAANAGILARLRALVAMNESLKQQEADFKAACKAEMARLEGLAAQLRSEGAGDSPEEQERLRLIDEQFEADSAKLAKIRLVLGKKNRELAILQRKIDEIPTRVELAQYQKRFLELYNQVAAKLTETKQYYTLYNTLDNTQMYMSKEVSLLNSIHDNFETALQSSDKTKTAFMDQFEGIVRGVQGNLDKVNKRKGDEKTRRDDLNADYLELVDKQRLYYKTVREFAAAVKTNEELRRGRK